MKLKSAPAHSDSSFAAGDCAGGFLQISVAVGEGAKAATSTINYVKKYAEDEPCDEGKGREF